MDGSIRGDRDSSGTLLTLGNELESVDLPAEFLEEARDAARSGAVGSVSDYVAEAVRLRLAKARRVGPHSMLARVGIAGHTPKPPHARVHRACSAVVQSPF